MTEHEFNKTMTTDRKRSMNQKIDEITSRIHHLKKVKRRWQLADNTLKICEIGLAFTLTLLTAIINLLPETLVSIPKVQILTSVISAIAGLTVAGSEATLLSFTGKNKRRFEKEIKKQEAKLNRSYIFYEKARSDAIISIEELAEFFALINKD